MNTPFRQFRENHFLFIRILAFGMTLLCGFINATIFLRFDFGGTHQTGNLSKIALSILSLDFHACISLVAIVFSFFFGSFIAGFINHEDFFVLKITFGFILLICGLGLWILELLLHDSQYLNYYCAFFAGLQNGFLTHNRLKLRASHVSGCFTDAGVYFGRLCRNHKEYLVKFILNVINIIIFFLGVLLGGYLFLHVREHVYMILSLLYVGLCIYYFVISFLFFHKPIDLEVT